MDIEKALKAINKHRKMPDSYCPSISMFKQDDGSVIIKGVDGDIMLGFVVGNGDLVDNFNGLRQSIWQYKDLQRLAGCGDVEAFEHIRETKAVLDARVTAPADPTNSTVA